MKDTGHGFVRAAVWGVCLLACTWLSLYAAESGVRPATPGAGTLADIRGAKSSHQLIPGDRVSVRVLQDADLNAEVMVDVDGNLNLQLLGDVRVVGLTLAAATKRIRDAYEKDYIYEPVISLSIVEYGKKRFTVIGAVNQPGDFLYRANQTVNILQAVGIAGGYSPKADPRKITVKRKVNGEEKVFKLDGRAMAREKDTVVFKIESNDIVSVGESIF